MSNASFMQGVKVRMLVGVVLLLLSAAYAGLVASKTVMLATVIVWLISVLLTDKYVHKYPQRYFTYLMASHAKADMVMALLLGAVSWVAGSAAAPYEAVWTGFIVFAAADFFVSLALGRPVPEPRQQEAGSSNVIAGTQSAGATTPDAVLAPVDKQAVLARICSGPDPSLVAFIESNLPDEHGNENVLILDGPSISNGELPDAETVGLMVSRIRINDIRHLNKFLRCCVSRLGMGGYLVCRYTPNELVAEKMQERFPGALFRLAYLLHFALHRALPKIPYLNAVYFSLTRGKNRMLSKVEVWGRLSYFGLSVVAESREGGEVYLIARRNAFASRNMKPSYYPVVALEKVGLGGEIVRLHKIRSMFPFSEFLQKRIFEDNGLAATGKFANDFRLTEYGEFIRKYWLDELPQIFDWLRGEIKLVGMRATSRHYLGLYPKELYDLYIQVKPGLIPPIFDESTNSFDKIVEIELAYLKNYMKHPFRTDFALFLRTFTDIFFRGVRSK